MSYQLQHWFRKFGLISILAGFRVVALATPVQPQETIYTPYRPICYLQTTNGQIVDLSHLCTVQEQNSSTNTSEINTPITSDIDQLLTTNACPQCLLKGANLTFANLTGANLEGADLRNTDLFGANLTGANLVGVNLEGAKIDGAILDGVNLSEAIMPDGTIWNNDATNPSKR